MPVLNCTFQGRAGNQIMQYLFCRAFACKWRYEFCCDPWVGEKVFDIDHMRYAGPALNRQNELLLGSEKGEDCEFRGYAQMQECMMYSKREAREWLNIRPEWLAILDRLRAHHFPCDSVVAHHRLGDFAGYNYPMVSRKAYRDAACHFFGGLTTVNFVSEEDPVPHTGLPDSLSFLPDFYRLMMAPTLMRANSSFSWIAGLLSNGVVLSPRIDGLLGGVEHDGVRFEAGNHCRLSDHSFCTELYVKP